MAQTVTDVRAVEIRAELRQIKSMADGTYNVTLNVPEYCLPQVQLMMAWLKRDVGVVIADDRRDDTTGDAAGRTGLYI